MIKVISNTRNTKMSKTFEKGPPCQKTSDPDGFIGKVIQTLERNEPTLHSIDMPGDFLSLFYKGAALP